MTSVSWSNKPKKFSLISSFQSFAHRARVITQLHATTSKHGIRSRSQLHSIRARRWAVGRMSASDTPRRFAAAHHWCESRYSAGWYQPRQNASSQVLLSRMAEMIKPTIE